MNKWVKKSIKLADRVGYLDNILPIYPASLGADRELLETIRVGIQKAFKAHNNIALIKELLKLPRFPIDDPYIASLRKYPDLIVKNPRTVKRITDRLFSINIDTILKLASQPKAPSRQLGQSFHAWLKKTHKYPFKKDDDEFMSSKGVSFLDGSDKKLTQFVNEKLGIKEIKKGIDVVFKAKGKYFIGEAKFLTDYGGTQNNQFDVAYNVARINKNNVIGIAILDGIVWFNCKQKMHKKVKSLKGIALSALLLGKFINSISS